MGDIRKVARFLKESGLLIKDVSKKTKNEAKEQKGGLLGMLLDTLGTRLLGTELAGKGVIRSSTSRAGRDF